MNYLGKCEENAYRLGMKRGVIITATILFIVGTVLYSQGNSYIRSKIRDAKKDAEAVADFKYQGELKKCKGFVKLVSGSEYDDVVKMKADADRIQGVRDGE